MSLYMYVDKKYQKYKSVELGDQLPKTLPTVIIMPMRFLIEDPMGPWEFYSTWVKMISNNPYSLVYLLLSFAAECRKPPFTRSSLQHPATAAWTGDHNQTIESNYFHGAKLPYSQIYGHMTYRHIH